MACTAGLCSVCFNLIIPIVLSDDVRYNVHRTSHQRTCGLYRVNAVYHRCRRPQVLTLVGDLLDERTQVEADNVAHMARVGLENGLVGHGWCGLLKLAVGGLEHQVRFALVRTSLTLSVCKFLLAHFLKFLCQPSSVLYLNLPLFCISTFLCFVSQPSSVLYLNLPLFCISTFLVFCVSTFLFFVSQPSFHLCFGLPLF